MTYQIECVFNTPEKSIINIFQHGNIIDAQEFPYQLSSIWSLSDLNPKYNDFDKVTGLKDGDYERDITINVYNRKCTCCSACVMINNVRLVVLFDGNEETSCDVTEKLSTWGCETQEDIDELLAGTPYECYNSFNIINN